MAQTKQELRSRIRSVQSTRKITSAMEMIANAKLFKQRKMMEKNREYAQILQDTVDEIVAKNPGMDHPLLQEKTSTKRLTIVFCSDLGLCGSYNNNILKLAKQVLRTEDPLMVIGTQLRHPLQEAGFTILNNPEGSDGISFLTLKSYIEDAEDMYLNDEISGIQILYTRFINTMTFRPEMDTLVPFLISEEKMKEPEGMHVETLFEPSPEEILDRLIPMMIQDVAYADWMEAKTAEQGNRRVAMNIATENADELSESLRLEYNKARQAGITQEITEIIGGSSAV